MVTNVKNGKKGSKKRSKAFAQAILGKPSGVIQPRVQQVGPEHFGIISVDCAKDRSKWMLCDFYGQVLVPPTPVEHRRTELQLTVRLIRKTFETAGIQDSIACVEMTGTYHQIVERTFKDAGFDTRLVHPFASSHYRPPEHGDLKTDDHDLVAIFRAAWLLVATNLIKCNAYWRGKYNRWKEQKYDPRDLRCRVANRLTRSIFSMISGRRIYQHPSRLDRSYVLNNILEFHRQHGSPMTTILADMQAATEQLPQSAHAAEAQPLAALQLKASRSRHAEPQALGELLVHVLARLGMTSPTPPINLNTLEAPVAELRVSDR